MLRSRASRLLVREKEEELRKRGMRLVKASAN
jgi:hypothetical protein